MSLDHYAAGLMDGEGYIGILHFKTADTYNIRIQVAMVTKGSGILDRMQVAYGGRLAKRKAETERNAVKDVWLLDGAEAFALLERIEPHLILKRDQARCAMALWRAILKSREEGGRCHWREPLRRHARHLMLRIQEGNQRGPEAEPPQRPDLEVVASRRWGEWWQGDGSEGKAFVGEFPTSGLMLGGVVYAVPDRDVS